MVYFIRMLNSDLNMLGKIDELRTYFDLGKTRVVNILYSTTQGFH